MALPEGFDIVLGIGMSALDRVIATAVRAGRFPTAENFVVSSVTWTLFETTWTGTWLRATVRGTRLAAPIRLVLRVRVSLSETRPAQLLAAAFSVDETTITIEGQEVPIELSPEEQRELLDAVNQVLVGRSLLDADQVLRAVRAALRLAREDDNAEDDVIRNTTIKLYGGARSNQHQDALLILYDFRGPTPVVTSAVSIVRAERDVVLGLAPRLLNQRILPDAIEQAFGALPVEVTRDDQTLTISRLTIVSDGSALRLQGSLTAAGHDILVQGPIHLFYSQPGHSLWVSGRDISANVAIPDWVLPVIVLTIPLVIGIAIGLGALLVKSVADAVASGIVSDEVEEAIRDGGLIDFGAAVGGVQLGDESPTLVVRYLEIDAGALLMGASLYAGAEIVRAVGTSGAKRLRWIQFDNGDILSIPDAAALIEAGRFVGTGLHTVDFSPGSIRTYLRANPDETERNNLRELPPVNVDLLLSYEHPGVWMETYFR